MKYLKYLLLVMMLCTVARAQSVADRDVRERLGAIEEKLTTIDSKVAELKDMMNSKPAESPKWICEAICYYMSDSYGAVFGKGPDAVEAMKDVLNECNKVLLSRNRSVEYRHLYMDDEDAKPHVEALIRNACLKN